MKDVEITMADMEKAFERAEHLTSLNFEVTKPRSYDGGKTYTFTASWES